MSASALPGVIAANGGVLPVLGQGLVILDGPQGQFRLENVQYVPNLNGPVVSAATLEENGYGTFLSRDRRYIFHDSDPDTSLLDVQKLELSEDQGRVYYLPYKAVINTKPMTLPYPEHEATLNAYCHLVMSTRGTDPNKISGTWEQWHSRLAHLSASEMTKLLGKDMVDGVTVSGGPCHLNDCPHCLMGKMTKTPFHVSESIRKSPLGLIHMDLMGPIE